MSKQYSNLGFNSDYQSKHVTLDDITFNNVKHVDTGHTQRLGRGTWSTLETSGTLTDNSFSVNAVDIDWNNAQWPSSGSPATPTTINTTGDLINAIKWASLQGSSFVLNQATSSSLGGIKVGYTQNGKNYPVQLSNGDAYVNVPWTNTTNITASINDADKKLLVSDDNGQKFQIKLSQVPIDQSDQNSEKIAALEITAGGDTINTILPGIKIDEQNRKMYWIGADGQQSSESLQFGSLDIIAVFQEALSYDNEYSRYWATMYFDGSQPSGNYFDEVIFVGDLILAPNSTDSKYHLYACYETTYVEEQNPRQANAYFVDLGVFPGDNISLSANDITVSGIDSQATGGNNIKNVQEALNYLLYYDVVDPSDVATLSD